MFEFVNRVFFNDPREFLPECREFLPECRVFLPDFFAKQKRIKCHNVLEIFEHVQNQN